MARLVQKWKNFVVQYHIERGATIRCRGCGKIRNWNINKFRDEVDSGMGIFRESHKKCMAERRKREEKEAEAKRIEENRREGKYG